MAMANLTDEELVVDGVLGYPRGYEKLCKQASTALTRPAFPQGPPHSFHSYSIPEDEAARMEELDALFPVVEVQEGINARIKHHAEDLWNQLDHLGNAGFDPALFRVDIYGNVIYWKAHEGSPLAWSIDHWFPRSRGGKSVPSNLRLVQWQVQQKKENKLEFLVPWWDLQIGVSVIVFLSVFSSPNADFRHKSFSLFFANGRKEKIDEKTMADCHLWPKSFLERVNEMGLLSASVVAVEKMRDHDSLKNIDISNNHNGNQGRRRWNIDEEETIRRPLIKCTGSMLSNRETKDKLYRSLRDESKHDKENRIPKDRHSSSISVAIEKEERIKISQEEQKKEKEAMIMELENQIRDLKMGNEKDKSMLEEFERVLAKQRMKLDKQRKWSESQSRYRICLEKMIRDTMQQCIAYKEQARRNQDACTALVARLESQRKICDVAEEEAEGNLKQRKCLEAMARPKITKRSRDAWDTDLHSWMDLNISYDAEFIKDHQGLVKGRALENNCEEESVGANVKSRNRESYLFEDEMESRSEIKKAMQAAMAEAIKEDEDEEVEETEERSIQKVGEKFNFENWFQVLLQNPEEMERCHTENPENMNSSDHEFLAKRGNIVNEVLKKLSCSQDQESDKMRGMVVPFAMRKAETLKPVDGNVAILGGGSEELMRKSMDQGRKINTDIVGDKKGSHDREEPVHRRQPQQRLAQNLAIKFETQSPTTFGQYSSSSPTTTSDTRSSNSTSHYEVITANKLKPGNNNNTNIGPKSPSLCRTGGECRRTTPLQKQRPVSCERSIVPTTTSVMKPHGAALLHNQPTRQQQIQRQESSMAAILSRQRSVGSGGGGGAARKADMLMKSASTRGNSSNSRTGTWTTLDSLSSSSPSFTSTAATISTSTSSEPVQQSPPNIARAMGRRCNSTSGGSHGLITSSAAVAPPPQVKKHLIAGVPVQAPPVLATQPRRKHSNFFQDLDSSISHVWKKAVKKFDLSRQHQ